MDVNIASVFSYGFMQNALIAGFLIGILLPLIGVIILSRRMVFLADSLGHINMSGIALATLLGSISASLLPYSFIISLLWTILGAILIEYVRDKYSEYKEVSITIVYTLSVALTMIFLNLSTGASSGIFNILFGNINAISTNEVKVMLVMSLIVLVLFKIMYSKLMLLSLEEEYLHLYGINPKLYRYLSMVVITLVISMAIKVVGVLLVSSLLLIPLLSGSRVAKTLKQTYIFTIIFTELSILSGIIIAYYVNLSTSAIIVLISLLIYVVVMLFKRGK